MKDENLHPELKLALKAFRETLSDWAATLKKPDGTIGVSHTAVIRVAQGKEDTPWIKDEIVKKIRMAKKMYPKFYKKVAG